MTFTTKASPSRSGSWRSGCSLRRCSPRRAAPGSSAKWDASRRRKRDDLRASLSPHLIRQSRSTSCRGLERRSPSHFLHRFAVAGAERSASLFDPFRSCPHDVAALAALAFVHARRLLLAAFDVVDLLVWVRAQLLRDHGELAEQRGTGDGGGEFALKIDLPGELRKRPLVTACVADDGVNILMHEHVEHAERIVELHRDDDLGVTVGACRLVPALADAGVLRGHG